MTWGEFKAAVEKAGVRDEDNLWDRECWEPDQVSNYPVWFFRTKLLAIRLDVVVEQGLEVVEPELLLAAK